MWLEYWDRQFYLYMTGQDPEAIRHSVKAIDKRLRRLEELEPRKWRMRRREATPGVSWRTNSTRSVDEFNLHRPWRV